ncbi:hypothetical protein D3238_13255, partial [Staphylococcus aureus]
VLYYAQNIHLEFSVILQICNRLIFETFSFYKECRSYKFCKMQISILLQFYCVKILAKNYKTLTKHTRTLISVIVFLVV